MNQQQKKIQRQERILSRLDKVGYVTRKQMQVIESLGGDRNAHRILHEMEKDKLISSVRREQKIYFLTGSGKNLIGSTKELKQSHIDHTLMKNDMYIKLGMPGNWQAEVPIKFNDQEKYLIPDAMFNVENKLSFIEIDNLQAMQTNDEKIMKYGKLFKAMFRQYKEHHTLIWYTLSEERKKKLEEACNKHGIKFRIYKEEVGMIIV